MATDPVPRRDELMGPYRRPLRHSLPGAWARHDQLQAATKGAGLLIVLGGAGLIAGYGLLALTLWFGVVVAVIVAALWGISAGVDSLKLRRAWARPSELGRVRAQRPQAGSADPEVAHDEFAVTVEDDGRLITWRFRPLAIDAEPGREEIEVPGRPRYAAQAVEDRTFDPENAARAAEQLVETQARAAEREARASDAAQRSLESAYHSERLAEETRSTAAALQRTTGQRRRRD
jgi:hypothetical protein